MESPFKEYKQFTNGKIQFQLNPTYVSYANTLRRLCMTHVETVGFRADILEDGATSDVAVEANSTPMTNEMLAHRFGLLPINVKNPSAWDPEKYVFTLDVTNEDIDKAKDVFASDIKVMEKQGELNVHVPSSSFFPPNPITRQTCLVATLKPMIPGGTPEEIRLKAKATVGIGRENARFIPTTQCAYKYTLDTNEANRKQVFDDWVIRSKMIKDPSSLETDAEKKAQLVREFETLEINRCYLKDEKTGEPYSFDFVIESAGVLSPEYIVLRACEMGASLCEKYTSTVFPDNLIVQESDSRFSAFDFFFQKEDHTLGNLIQTWIDAHKIDSGEVTFVAYDIPHPLRDEMVLRIGVADGKEATARSVLSEAMASCQAMFRSWRDNWASLTNPIVASSQPVASATTKPTKKKVVRLSAQSSS